MMQMSEAIAIGSTVIHAVPYTIGQDDYGCAAKMAVVAASRQHKTLGQVWPWSTKALTKPVPCGCSFIQYSADDPAQRKSYPICDYIHAIQHLFNEHVMDYKRTGKVAWTLEQLIDWVCEVEPKEDEAMQQSVEEIEKESLFTFSGAV